MVRRLLPVTAALAGSAALLACATPGIESPPPLDWEVIEAEAASRLSEYLRIDTTNPPGNEVSAVPFLRGLFEDTAIEVEEFASAPGRASLVARLRGSGAGGAILLMHHIDVVAADARYWERDPFGGEIVDGQIWGRGALDTKGLGITHALAMRTLAEQRVPLNRDIVLLAVADEEAGGAAGAGYMVESHFDAFRGAAFMLNEGGAIQADADGRALAYAVEAAQKVPLWLRLRVRGTPGHGSMPRPDAAPTRLVRALSRIAAYETPLRVLPRVQRFHADMAHLAPPDQRSIWADLAAALEDPDLEARFTSDVRQNAMIRNTISITRFAASPKTNVIPPEATAELDVRLLPDQDPDAFVATLREVVADPAVEIERLLSFPPAASPVDHPFFDALRRLAARYDPEAIVTPTMAVGFTDCHFFRERGIPCYGFAPFRITPQDRDGIHGNNERLSVEELGRGTKMTYELLRELATDAP
ncbi:MAG: M20/M25/M40 family metallo-hydrolase [Myxococcota bacterium]